MEATATHAGDRKTITFTLGDSPTEVIVQLDTHVEPQALDVSVGPAGMLRLTFGTVSGLDYQIEESGDLHTWSPIGPLYAGNGGIVTLDVPASQTEHFYRLRVSRPAP